MSDQIPAVDLTNCDREPIHIPGGIQPHGILIAVSPELQILQVSENVRQMLGLNPIALLGQSVIELVPPRAREMLRHELLNKEVHYANPVMLPIEVHEQEWFFDGLVSRSQDSILLELENPRVATYLPPRSVSSVDAHFRLVRKAVSQIHSAIQLDNVCEILVNQVREFTGFDRVMVYRFSNDGHGQVIAESMAEGQESYLGLHYPASDIPLQARRLYTKNWLRLIPNINYTPAKLIPLINPRTNQPLDMSQSVLRSVSPVHLEYLRNMGVAASMSISLVQGDHLWGLIACHHRSSRFVPYEVRAGCELLGSVMSLQLSTKESGEAAVDEARLKTLQAELLWTVADSNSVLGMADNPDVLLKMMTARGAVIQFDGQRISVGQTPSDQHLDDLLAWLQQRGNPDVVATSNLSGIFPPAEEYVAKCSGLISIALSRVRGDFALFFRPEVLQEVNWAGDPLKAAILSANGEETLSPRKSFKKWQTTVHGHAIPWRPFEIGVAKELRNSLVTFIIQRAEELDRINKELERSNVELDAFAYVASNDLKEPLRGIHRYAYQLSEGIQVEANVAVHEKINGIMRLTERMDDLLDSLLHFSRVGRVELHHQTIDLNLILHEALDMISQKSVEQGGNIRVPRPLPTVACDSIRIREVFSNLISNGLKYNDSDHPCVEVGYIEDKSGVNGALEFYVRDNGIGLASRYHEKVFQMFKRLHAPGEYGGGTGAGLTIVRKIIQRHNGSIRIASEFGSGSTFYFTLQTPEQNL